MTRPSLDEHYLDVALLLAKRSTCLRRGVGCVLVDAHGHVLSTGHNGVPSGFDHCNEEQRASSFGNPRVQYPHACSVANAQSGTQLDACLAVHAEQNALLQCPNADAIHTCYVTVSPCGACLKMLLNTSCQRIVAAELYAASHVTLLDDWWIRRGRGYLTLTR